MSNVADSEKKYCVKIYSESDQKIIMKFYDDFLDALNACSKSLELNKAKKAELCDLDNVDELLAVVVKRQ